MRVDALAIGLLADVEGNSLDVWGDIGDAAVGANAIELQCALWKTVSV